MKYLSVAEISAKWNISERTVRNYCASGRIPGAFLDGKTWRIPEDAQRPARKKRNTAPRTLLAVLREAKESKTQGGIYHQVQIDLTYNSNHIEGSKLSHDQTRYIYETNTIGMKDEIINIDDIVETVNHFKCIDMIIDNANYKLSERFIKQLHFVLKSGTSDSRKDWFAVGEYKRYPNEVGGMETVLPEQVEERVQQLLNQYNQNKTKTFEEVLEFHYEFETIHPFQDGNGRVGRLILFKECLRNNLVPFIIDEELKLYYYRGLHEWKSERGYLRDTCLTAQDKFKRYLDYFRIVYEE